MLIINDNKDVAAQEVAYLNEITKPLLNEGEKLVRLESNEAETVFYYPLVKQFERFYTDEMLNKKADTI
jgi:hypothetical protein